MTLQKFKSISDLVYYLKLHDYMAVIDIQNAYRAVPIHSLDRGIKWEIDGETKYYIDNRLCMGLSSSPFIFT